MAERRKILALAAERELAALATLVGVAGSSYRRPGARLLIAADGTYAGAISGGCLEAELIRKAQWAVRSGAVVQRYSTLFDDTAEIPYGLGCGGEVRVLLEPAGTPEFAAMMEALAATERGEVRRVRTELPVAGRGLRRVVCAEDGSVVFASEAVGEAVECFEELMGPPQRLVVLGAGDDAQPIVRMAYGLGWRVMVVDGRTQWARTERFPEAAQVICSDRAAFELREDDAVVVMTHSYEQDRAWLVAALSVRPRYLGLLGARHRSALLMRDAAEQSDCAMEEICERVFAPVGLDLGGDGAESIALAVVSEIQAVLHGKLGAPRRMTPELVEALLREGPGQFVAEACAL